jgi:dihydroorotate dehydrogenase
MKIYSVFKHLAFKLDPEFIHDVTINSAHLFPFVSKLFNSDITGQKYQLKNGPLSWNFPVGVAAGFDKNALAIRFFENLGFGAVEIGTVTKRPQEGNPKPRVFRHPSIKSIQNAMGFPNQGSTKILQNLQSSNHQKVCIGTNIGKNKETSEAMTPDEYAYLYKMFASFSDYLVVNISSPNTPGLRNFQKKELLMPILIRLKQEQEKNFKPIFIKIAPDVEMENLKMICELSKELKFNGIVATNTTIQHKFGKGGLSGEYIKPYAKEVRMKTCEFLREDPSQIVIGVGGIDCYQDIKEFWKQGGSFTQIYSSFIYHGPELLNQIKRGMDLDMKRNNFATVQELHKKIKEID